MWYPGRLWYLIVSFPDLFRLSYLVTAESVKYVTCVHNIIYDMTLPMNNSNVIWGCLHAFHWYQILTVNESRIKQFAQRQTPTLTSVSRTLTARATSKNFSK